MENNLIPPFILREAGLQVKDMPKIHVKDPNTSDHAITFPEHNLRIPLQLHGISSFFHHRMPTPEEVSYKEPIFLTPDSNNWNPHSDHYALNKDSMLDWERNMNSKQICKEHVLGLNTAVDLPTWEATIEGTLAAAFKAIQIEDGQSPDGMEDDGAQFAQSLHDRAQKSKFSASNGSVLAYMEEARNIDAPIFGHLDDYKAKVDALEAKKPGNLSPEFLSCIWQIKPDLVKKALNQTIQLCRKGEDNELSCQFSINNQMLQYKQINSQFYKDTFFITGKGKLTRGNTCAQSFVSDKGFVAIYPMVQKGDYLQALHLFCKEIGVPAISLVDPSGEQGSSIIRLGLLLEDLKSLLNGLTMLNSI